MKKVGWKRRIKQACEAAGTYQSFYDSIIDTLSGIMEIRDDAAEKFKDSGGDTVIFYTNKSGATNLVKNPALVVLMDCNAQALQYWHQLGLTPKSFKAMTGSLNVKVESETLESALANLGI